MLMPLVGKIILLYPNFMPRAKHTIKRENGAGTVSKVGERYRWQLTLGYDADGKRQSASGYAPSRIDAEQALVAARVLRDRGQIAQPNAVTVAEYAQVWLARQRLNDPTPKGGGFRQGSISLFMALTCITAGYNIHILN
jgi:hypothetical protein